ncbi:hypothetical protein GQ44DRAFT_785569 [Phaeosphaeriaceae sp. PMI808]|nr:hypothetical protein GQ44DRAFT_785569 [Phaeosphaeriaceae sp. PMI808]
MKFFAILAVFTSVAFAADICRPLGNDCFGSASCCNGIQENRCCNFGTTTTRIRMQVPANSRSQGWTGNSCTGSVATNVNNAARNVCFTYGSSRQSGRWLTGTSALRIKRDPEVEECAEPNVVLRVRDGVTTRIELRDGMTVEDALQARDGDVVEATPFVGEFVTSDE